jgi:hypothetical protein
MSKMDDNNLWVPNSPIEGTTNVSVTENIDIESITVKPKDDGYVVFEIRVPNKHQMALLDILVKNVKAIQE